MRPTYAKPIPQSQDTLTVFRGLNQTLTVGDGEFAAMQNMTGEHYPVLSPRDTRLNCHAFTKCNGIYGKDRLIWVDGTTLYYDGVAVGTVADSAKTFVGMGAYVLIFPDKLVLNTNSVADGLTGIEATFETVADTTFAMCDIDGVAFDYTADTEPPENPASGAYWLDESGENKTLKRYSSVTNEWSVISTMYVKIGSPSIGYNFNQYDGVEIAGCSDSKFNTSLILVQAADDYIVVEGVISENFTQEYGDGEGAITVKRECPDMEYFTECNNRVWGCSSTAHEIYACRQGDPFNWRAYEDVSTASYAVTVGTDGAFTGAATYQGYPVFFKENAVHKIIGSMPQNFGMSTLDEEGVQSGCGRSIATVNSKLLYKAVSGVVAFDGAYAVKISNALGFEPYTAAVGGKVDNKYYVSMKDGANAYHLFAYDTETGLWHREDPTRADWFAICQSDTFFVSDNVLWSITKNARATAFNETEETNPLSWYAETGDILWTTPNNKHVVKLQIGLSVGVGASVNVYVQYDSSGAWELAKAIAMYTYRKAESVYFIPRRCNHFRLKLAGVGEAKIYAITRTLEGGSEL